MLPLGQGVAAEAAAGAAALQINAAGQCAGILARAAIIEAATQDASIAGLVLMDAVLILDASVKVVAGMARLGRNF